MEIDGPLIISVQEDNAPLKRELHISFKPTFVQLQTTEHAKLLTDYMEQLNSVLQILEQDNPDRLGMETVHQICDDLREHIRVDESDLDETIVIEIPPTVGISGFVSGGSSIN
jgi:hypothetical protein